MRTVPKPFFNPPFNFKCSTTFPGFLLLRCERMMTGVSLRSSKPKTKANLNFRMFIVGDLCQVFPMKTGFTKCHFCGRIASTCVGRSVYSTLIWRALRAQMSNFNLRLASSSGPRCPISTCVWRAHSGPRYSMFQLTSGELTPGPDFQIQLSSGELLSGPRCSVCVNFRLASSSRAQTDRSSTNEKEKKR